MSLMSNKGVLQLRRAARALGVPKLLGHFGRDYEGAFSRPLMAACKAGDVVWDVGANVGHYTLAFADRVGPAGKVFAFEPDETNLRRLQVKCHDSANISICGFGLSDQAERRRFLPGSDGDHATSRVLTPGERVQAATEVELKTGDSIIGSDNIPLPNVIKVDVEGHELPVLRGLKTSLANARLRQLFIEVHFGILDRSGRAGDPKRIEELLRSSGFKLAWIDPSHLHAFRAA